MSKIRIDVAPEKVNEYLSVTSGVQPVRFKEVFATSALAIKLITELLPTPVSPKRMMFWESEVVGVH